MSGQLNRPLCALCVKRAAETLDEIDGRRIPVCKACVEECVPDPPPPPLTRERLLSALRRSPGADIQELGMALGEDSEIGRGKLCAALRRAIADGLITFEGNKMDRSYYLAPKARRPAAAN